MSNDQQHDPLDDLVRRALAREAEQVRPDPDGLYKIRQRVGTESRSRKPWLFTVAGAGVAAAAAVGLFAMLDRNTTGQTTAEPPVASSPSSATTTGATPRPATPTVRPIPTAADTTADQSPTPSKDYGVRAVPVYWLGNTVGRLDAGQRLYRTFVRVKAADPALGAVAEMTGGRPSDPDYVTPWTGASPLSVVRRDGLITVDFGSLPAKELGAKDSTAAVQQLVYTVQGALRVTDPVRVRLKGGPAGKLFGHVDSATPFRRAPQVDVQAFVWITTPEEGAGVTAPVKVTGVASTFEATVNWRVRDVASKRVVQENYTTATAGTGEFGDFQFTVRLPRGKYVLECLELSAEDGRDTNTDTKTIVVR
jgi:hypothetical protein